MDEIQLIDLLHQGQFDNAQVFIKNNQDIDLNYTDKDKDSILIIAVRATNANPTRLASFVDFFLQQERFALVNYSVKKQTAFDLAVVSANLDVTETFFKYHYKNDSLEHVIYAGNGELKFKLVQDCLKSYQAKYQNTPSSDTESLAYFRGVIDSLSHKSRILRDVAIRFAMHHDNPTILQQLKEAGDITSLPLQDLKTWPNEWAQELGKRNITQWFHNEALSNTTSLSKSTSPSAHSLFANRLSDLKRTRDAARASRVNDEQEINQNSVNERNDMNESIHKMHY